MLLRLFTSTLSGEYTTYWRAAAPLLPTLGSVMPQGSWKSSTGTVFIPGDQQMLQIRAASLPLRELAIKHLSSYH